VYRPFFIRVWDIPASDFSFSGKGPENGKNPQVWLHLLCLLSFLFSTYKALRTLENTRKRAEKDTKK